MFVIQLWSGNSPWPHSWEYHTFWFSLMFNSCLVLHGFFGEFLGFYLPFFLTCIAFLVARQTDRDNHDISVFGRASWCVMPELNEMVQYAQIARLASIVAVLASPILRKTIAERRPASKLNKSVKGKNRKQSGRISLPSSTNRNHLLCPQQSRVPHLSRVLDETLSRGCLVKLKYAYYVASKSTASSPCSNVPIQKVALKKNTTLGI